MQARQRSLVVALLRDVAIRYFERTTYTGGRPLLPRVDCGTDPVAFVEPGSSVPCTATVGDKKYAFAFQVNDPEGGFTIVATD